MKSWCGSGGWLYACPERDAIPSNPPVEFGPFGWLVSPDIASDTTPPAGPDPVQEQHEVGIRVPVWDGSGFSEFVTEYKTKSAAAAMVEPQRTRVGFLWWVLAIAVALILWKR